ncbi:hypothetical protein BCR41DRAFT_411521 [Lobosporangium transversale]|uniref:Uncharacterized protein n=1 Tax=Lobosporangium transversale TaxID=64571 RepID=A0A1Y2GFH5_9FUNG|nr:hypothetical protein BCR41DRAFT_411521 [Lobosporangium transversale]ORZ08025.1 hypothetical protein BCR41DRAFT_411521 [Lobosporangium transversale]|eukprot:XP_021878259.1 hypothetical protein BCR41DRAFT_411521 [Lobosporangium transversale]
MRETGCKKKKAFFDPIETHDASVTGISWEQLVSSSNSSNVTSIWVTQSIIRSRDLSWVPFLDRLIKDFSQENQVLVSNDIHGSGLFAELESRMCGLSGHLELQRLRTMKRNLFMTSICIKCCFLSCNPTKPWLQKIDLNAADHYNGNYVIAIFIGTIKGFLHKSMVGMRTVFFCLK